MKKQLSDEIATRKRSINYYSLAMSHLPDPDIVLKKQGKDIRVYKELLCDSHVFACVQSRKSGILSLEWDINRGLDKDKTTQIVNEVIKNLDVYKLINDILDATLFGFQPIEVIWKKVGNYILPVELKAKPPEWFCFDDDNQLKFRTKENYYGEELPARKFLCPQANPSYENPYGERTLSRVFWPVTFKKGGLKFWVIFTEKYGIPHLIGKHPRGANKEETDQLADLLEQMVQDAIAVIPDDSSVEIQEANKSSSAEIFEKLIDKMNAEISKAILGQTLTTEIGSTGSYAAANTHMSVRQDIIDSDKKLVESVINQLIRWIYEINFSNQNIPIFEMYAPEDVDLTLAQRDKILSETGVKFTKEYFIKTYGLEDEDFEIREDFYPIQNPNFKEFSEFWQERSRGKAERVRPCERFDGVKSFSKEKDGTECQNLEPPIIQEKQDDEGLTPGQEQLENLFGFISETKLSEQAQKLLKPFLSLVDSCDSYEEFEELLNEKNLHSKTFEQDLQKALFLCELQGRSDGLDE